MTTLQLDLELTVSLSTQCVSLKKSLHSLMKLKLLSLERHWFWLKIGLQVEIFFIEVWILRGNKTPLQKGKCPPGWMNCSLGKTRSEEGLDTLTCQAKLWELHKWSFWSSSSCFSLLSSWMGGGEEFLSAVSLRHAESLFSRKLSVCYLSLCWKPVDH